MPDLLAVEKAASTISDLDDLHQLEDIQGVGHSSGDTGKRQAVGDGECDGQVEWAISFVRGLIEGAVGIDDLGDIVGFAVVVEGARVEDTVITISR